MAQINLTCVVLTLWLLASTQVFAQTPEVFKVGNLAVNAGSKTTGYLVVPDGIDAGTRIPVTLIHGKRSGPVLALIAGTHGYEYPAISALHRVGQLLDPEALAGTVILVHMANPPAFWGRTIYTGPVDGKNLNRVYPGNENGTLSERIALVITRQVIERSNYLVDLHGGDGNELLMPYVYMPVTGNAELDLAAKGMAIAFGLDHIVIDEAPMPSAEHSIFTDHTALSRGIPAITTETGQLGSNDDKWIDLAEAGIGNLMRHLKMLGGAVRSPAEIVWLYGYEVLPSPTKGFFTASVTPGQRVQANAVIGRIMDDFGNQTDLIKAPFAGVVNYVLGTPPVGKDEPVAMISRVKAN